MNEVIKSTFGIGEQIEHGGEELGHLWRGTLQYQETLATASCRSCGRLGSF
jgi:hypothetical protein